MHIDVGGVKREALVELLKGLGATELAAHVAPALGWQPNHEGPVTGYPID